MINEIQHRHVGVYGIVIQNERILLIKKKTGPYDGKLDLPGGSFEFGEKPDETLKREFFEETGIEIDKYSLLDVDSVMVDWKKDKYTLVKVHHVGIFYKVNGYRNEIKKVIEINEVNDDSMGADFYDINTLYKNELSATTVLELEKLGYNIK